jgi:hypothetical protein
MIKIENFILQEILNSKEFNIKNLTNKDDISLTINNVENAMRIKVLKTKKMSSIILFDILFPLERVDMKKKKLPYGKDSLVMKPIFEKGLVIYEKATKNFIILAINTLETVKNVFIQGIKHNTDYVLKEILDNTDNKKVLNFLFGDINELNISNYKILAQRTFIRYAVKTYRTKKDSHRLLDDYRQLIIKLYEKKRCIYEVKDSIFLSLSRALKKEILDTLLITSFTDEKLKRLILLKTNKELYKKLYLYPIILKKGFYVDFNDWDSLIEDIFDEVDKEIKENGYKGEYKYYNFREYKTIDKDIPIKFQKAIDKIRKNLVKRIEEEKDIFNSTNLSIIEKVEILGNNGALKNRITKIWQLIDNRNYKRKLRARGERAPF